MGLKACCYCIDLRKGSLISGYLILIYHAVILALQITSLISLYLMFQGLDELAKRHVYFSKASAFLVAQTIITLLALILTIVLLVGLHKNKSGAVLTFIVLAAIFLVLQMSIFCWNTKLNFRSIYSYTVVQWSDVGLQFLFACLYVYFLCVFGSYYNKMREGQDGECSKSYYV